MGKILTPKMIELQKTTLLGLNFLLRKQKKL